MAELWKGMDRGNRGRKFTLTPNAPIRCTDRAEGRYDDMLALASNYRNSGWTAQIEQQGDSPVWSCVAEVEGDPSNPNEDLQNTHELRVNIFNPDIKANRHLQSQFAGNAVESISYVQSIADKVRGNQLLYSEAVSEIQSGGIVEAPDFILAVDLLDLILLGTENYVDFAYVYRHSFNTGTIQQKEADFSNVRCIFSTDGMIFAEGIPEFLQLPDGEWLKNPPEQIVERGGRKCLTYEYWWAEAWSNLLYASAT